jgi:hypothetical protein
MTPERVAAKMPEWNPPGAPPTHEELERLWAADWNQLRGVLRDGGE